MSQTPDDPEPTTATRQLGADSPRDGTLTLTLRREIALFGTKPLFVRLVVSQFATSVGSGCVDWCGFYRC